MCKEIKKICSAVSLWRALVASFPPYLPLYVPPPSFFFSPFITPQPCFFNWNVADTEIEKAVKWWTSVPSSPACLLLLSSFLSWDGAVLLSIGIFPCSICYQACGTGHILFLSFINAGIFLLVLLCILIVSFLGSSWTDLCDRWRWCNYVFNWICF